MDTELELNSHLKKVFRKSTELQASEEFVRSIAKKTGHSRTRAEQSSYFSNLMQLLSPAPSWAIASIIFFVLISSSNNFDITSSTDESNYEIGIFQEDIDQLADSESLPYFDR